MDMGLEDVCDTAGLVLCLGLLGGGHHGGRGERCSPSGSHEPHKAKPDREIARSSSPPDSDPDSLETSLTLGRETEHGGKAGVIVARQPSPHSHSMTSSFSDAHPTTTSSVKRERDVGGEEVERVSSRVSDDQDDDGGAKKKLRLTKDQSALLEERFKEHSTLNPKQKLALANQLNLRPRQVEVWFQNRRARTKLKQTEVDCELLKKCCETLSDENRRLQNELQHLKALKAAVPPYMRVPPAALTVCPSCERIRGGATSDKKPSKEGVAAAAAFMVGQKPHFLGPFTHPPSATC